jgi:hypothetical protein
MRPQRRATTFLDKVAASFHRERKRQKDSATALALIAELDHESNMLARTQEWSRRRTMTTGERLLDDCHLFGEAFVKTFFAVALGPIMIVALAAGLIDAAFETDFGTKVQAMWKYVTTVVPLWAFACTIGIIALIAGLVRLTARWREMAAAQVEFDAYVKDNLAGVRNVRHD